MSVAGHDLASLAQEHGTPLHVLDEDEFRDRCREWRRAAGGGLVHYAGKAFLCSAVARWAIEEGLGVDVSSQEELSVALRTGVAPASLTLHGNNKSEAELRLAVRVGVGRIVVDSRSELTLLDTVATELRTPVDVVTRLVPGVTAGVHAGVQTGHEDQKFGLSLAAGVATDAVLACEASEWLTWLGPHCHVGSQVTKMASFTDAADVVLTWLATMHREHGVQAREINLGGGFAIPYVPGDESIDPWALTTVLRDYITQAAERLGIPVPRLALEPGRAIVGPAAVTVYTVGSVKQVASGRTYVAVDGGMSDAPRTALYGSRYTARTVRDHGAATTTSRVVGRHCESGDVVVPDSQLPRDIARGDLLAVAATGAYHRSMASNYNWVPRPPVVALSLIRQSQQVIVRRESLDDLLRLDPGLVVPGDDDDEQTP